MRHSHDLVLIQGHTQFISEQAVFLKLRVEAIFAVRKQVEKQREDRKSEENRRRERGIVCWWHLPSLE